MKNLATFSFDQFGDAALLWSIHRGGRPKCGKKLELKRPCDDRHGMVTVRVEVVGEIVFRGETTWVVREVEA